MSQHHRMNPTINFSHIDGAGYESQSYQFNDIYPQQWMSSGQGNVIPTALSTTDTMRTNWNAPPRLVNQMNAQRPKNISQQHRNIDPRLQASHPYLLPPGAQTNPVVQQVPETIVNPIARFYHQEEQPWSVLGMGMRNPQKVGNRSNYRPTPDSYSQYRQGPCSDVGSNVPASDSGYYTQPTRSVLSNEPDHVHQDLPLEIMDQARNLNVDCSPIETQAMARRASDQGSVSQYSSRSANQKQIISCPEPDCPAISRCQSEHKKHMLKHKKEYVCTEPDCKRAGEGFSTVNDLDRHKKSVHKIGITNSKSWQCAARSCTNKTKIWPRLDNFKQHIERMHKDEDMLDLIKRSEYSPQEQQTEVQSLSIDPSHLLAGMGSEPVVIDSPNGTSFSTNIPSFEYPQYMSISGRSNSGASHPSPCTDSLGIPTSQSTSVFLNGTDSNTSMGQSVSQRTESLSQQRTGHRKTSHVSSTGAIQKPISAQGSKRNGIQALPLKLTSTAQTKSEQQRQALEKLSKAKLEDILLRVLAEQTQQDDTNGNPPVDLSENNGVYASQALADLIQQSTKLSRAPQRRLTQGSSSGIKKCSYQDCDFHGRPCDLNKHVKRHRKPYGCTYPKCHKRFGAKSDWKRHENSQHFQQETFRCDVRSSGQQCGQHYHHVSHFKKHLELEHSVMSQTEVQNKLEQCKIGRNCQNQYWCGFCCEIKKLKAKRNAAWDERFDHIAIHFERDTPKKCIDEWICVEENKTKKQLREEMESAKEGKDVDADGSNDDDDETPTARSELADGSSQMSMQKGPNKRMASASVGELERPGKQMKQATILWFCCSCQREGGVFSTIQVSCPSCQQPRCENCEWFEEHGPQLPLLLPEANGLEF